MTTLYYAYELTLGVLDLTGRKGNRNGDERKPFTVYLEPVRKAHGCSILVYSGFFHPSK